MMSNGKNKKAFFFTLDTIIAILLLTTLMIAIFMAFSQASTPFSDNIPLESLGMDTLVVLDQDIKDAIATNATSSLHQSLAALLPENVCMKIQVTHANVTDLDLIKPGCTPSEFTTISRRVIYRKNMIYLAEGKTWLRGKT